MKEQFLPLFVLLLSVSWVGESQITAQEKDPTEKKAIGTRVWKDKTGNFSVEALIISGNRNQARLKLTKDGSIFEVPVAKLSASDRQYVFDYCDAIFEELKNNSREKIFASEALKLFQDFVDKKFVDETNEVYIELKMEHLKKEAERGAIIVNDQFITMTELGSFRQKSNQLVSDWIGQAKGDDMVLLRQAHRDDPTSIEAGILLAFVFDLKEAQFQSAERFFLSSIKNAVRFTPIAGNPEKHNLLVAKNNYAVLNLRLGRVRKAMNLWTQILDATADSAPSEVEFNILKTAQLLNDEKRGLTTDSVTTKKLNQLRAKCKVNSYSMGGWRLMLPIDQSQRPRAGLQFLISDEEKQRVHANFIEDSRCVRCSGSGTMPCPNKICELGKIKEHLFRDHTLNLGNGSFKIVRLPDGVKYHDCPTCRGNKQIACVCCDKGIQD